MTSTRYSGCAASVVGNEPVQRLTEFQKAQNWALSGRKSVEDALGWFIAHDGDY